MDPSQHWPNSQSVQIQTLTWSRDSNGLFDYESKSLQKAYFLAKSTSRLIRIGNDCLIKNEDYDIDPGAATGLAWIMEYESECYLDGFLIKPDQSSDQLWMVIPPTKKIKPGTGHRLSQGDEIRLGRMAFTIVQVSPTGADHPIFFTTGETSLQVPPQPVSPVDGEKIPCRICLSDVATESDPLITPCKCAGTMKFIHLKCLRGWVHSRLQIKITGNVASYYWKSLDCELCKEVLPSKIVIDGLSCDLVDIHKPNTPFIVLEDARDHNQERQRSGGIHVLSMTGNSIVTLVASMQGRGHDNDIRISDISVSRLHASIQLLDDTFYLYDRKSKFGTLVLVKKWLGLFPGINISLQINRTVVNLRVKKSRNIWKTLCKCCFPQPKVNPSSGDVTLAEKMYGCKDRTSQFEDAFSFSHLLMHQSAIRGEVSQPDPVAALAERIVIHEFNEADDRPTTRARSFTSQSQLFRSVEPPLG